MTNYVPDDNDYCVDCNVNTMLIREYYMVHQHVWFQTQLGSYDGMLCIGCLENRIGRRLTPSDFSDFPVNNFLEFPKSDRLLSRMVL